MAKPNTAVKRFTQKHPRNWNAKERPLSDFTAWLCAKAEAGQCFANTADATTAFRTATEGKTRGESNG